MNTYRKRYTGALLSEEEVRRGFNGMLPAVLDAPTRETLDIDPVLITPSPAVTADQTAVRDGVVLDKLGNWVYGWRVEPKTPAQIAADRATRDASARDEAKRLREDAVGGIKVTTAAGHTFDGDEISQGRMARAIIALQASNQTSSVVWVLADNSVIDATAAELTEALALAGAAQAALWVIE